MINKKSPGLWVETGGDEKISVVIVDADEQEQHFSPVTPGEDLIAAAEIDYAEYRREIQRLYDEHPLFEDRTDVSAADLEDLAAEALMLPCMLEEIDPLSFFEVVCFLDGALQMKDDGTAAFLLQAGQRLLQVLEIPIRTQIRLRNILEMTFDGTERATQQERFEKLRAVYPEVAQICDPAQLDVQDNEPLLFRVESVYGLRLLELMLYFRQEKQRITRCDYCWNYFIPKTKAATHYCDRVFEGQSCKQRGANLKRKQGPELDGALKLFKQLRDRMYARMLRYTDAHPNRRDRLIPMSLFQYGEWEDNARRARRDYIAGKIPAEEFLRRIDTMHDLDSYDTVKQELLPEESVWQKRVAADPDFDPQRRYEPMMVLDLGADDPQWRCLSEEDLIQKDQEGHQSLQERYGKRSPVSSDEAKGK